MLSEARKQSMVWMETDYSKHTHFRGKIRWRLGHLGALGIMGEAAPLMFNVNKVQTISLLSEQPTRESVGNNGWKSWEKCILTTIARMIKNVEADTYSAHILCGCENSFIELMMGQFCIDAGREHDFTVRCMSLYRFFYGKNRMEQNRFGVKVEWENQLNHKKCALMWDKFPKESI